MRARLSDAPELLDDAMHDAGVLEASLHHVAQVNRYLGGESSVLHALEPLLTPDATTRILDIGTGAGDIPVAVAAAARRRGASVSITATDIHPQMRALATARARSWPEVNIEYADALSLPWPDASFDAALLTLTLHHFEGDEPARVLREAGRVARLVVVSDLERSALNYAGARLLAWTWWRSNPLTRHDGPLSVLRAFTSAELRDIATRAGLRNVRVERRWFGRLLLTAEGPAR
ncbi:MAG TPA: methyltransferase domain-containing protein [Longimicrobiales bacterium]